MPGKAVITDEAIRRHLHVATSRSDLLRALGVAPATKNYQRLEAVAAQHGLTLPPKNPNGRSGSRPELRTSVLWDKEKLCAAVVGARTLRQVVTNLGLTRNAIPRLQVAAEEFGIELPRSHGGPDPAQVRAAAIERVLVKGARRVNGQRLKKYMTTLGVFPNFCAICGQPPEWNGIPLILQVDHANGDPTDNRVENLRLLCPNCHSQTDTFAGRNNGRSTMGSGVTGNTPGSDPGDGHVHPGSNPGSPAFAEAVTAGQVQRRKHRRRARLAASPSYGGRPGSTPGGGSPALVPQLVDGHA
jgi:hypothetical protein